MTHRLALSSALSILAVCSGAFAQPPADAKSADAKSADPKPAESQPAQPAPAEPAAPLDWKSAEAKLLKDHVQLTFPAKFIRAGEAYFNTRGSWIVFQAIPRPDAGQKPDDHYAMYVAKVKFDADRTILGLEEPIRVSPEGSANTCGNFNPSKSWQVIFGSTLTPPKAVDTPGYQRGTRSYRWAFPAEMNVVQVSVPAVQPRMTPSGGAPGNAPPAAPPSEPVTLIQGPAYDAECAYDPSGRFIIYATQRGTDEATGRPTIGIDAYDSQKNASTQLVTAPGYNGGPFFNADTTMICYRSDRAGDDLLQVYVADLDKAPDGSILGIKNERRVTDNQHVNWGPFFHPSGDFLVYATSEVGHDNYEVFAVEVPRGANAWKKPAQLSKKRVTHASGFDGLPVFSSDGLWMLWTSQRGQRLADEPKPSSQLWAARVLEIKPGETSE